MSTPVEVLCKGYPCKLFDCTLFLIAIMHVCDFSCRPKALMDFPWVFAAEFATYLNYCRQLRFEDRPDYAYLRGLFKDLYIKEGFDVRCICQRMQSKL